jgi:hypothetical protein
MNIGKPQRFMDHSPIDLKTIVMCIFSVGWMHVSHAQPTDQNSIETAIYKVAIDAVFSDPANVGHAYFPKTKPCQRDFFIVIPTPLKEAITLGRRQDKFIVDTLQLHKKLRRNKTAHLISLNLEKPSEVAPYQYACKIGVDAIVKKKHNTFERRLVPSPLFVKDEDYVLCFTVKRDEGEKWVVIRYMED